MANKFLDKTGLSTLWTKIKSLLNNKADKVNGVYYIQGNTSGTAGKWTGTSDKIDAYYDGLLINYKIGIAGGESTTTLNINGLGAKPCYLRGTTNITTHYAVGTMVILSYNASNGAFYSADYDANTNTYQRLYPSTTNVEYPITTRYNTSTGKSYYAEYGRYSTGVTLNPSTNTITATTFKGNATSATKATKDGDGNVIKNTYATKTSLDSKVNKNSGTATDLTLEGTTYIGNNAISGGGLGSIRFGTGTGFHFEDLSANKLRFANTKSNTTYDLTVPTKSGTIALLEDLQNIGGASGSYLPLSGGTMTGNIKMEYSCTGLSTVGGSSIWGFDDGGEPCLLNQQGRFIKIATTSLDDDYLRYDFPEHSGEVVVKDESGKIKISPGGGIWANSGGFSTIMDYPAIFTDDWSIYVTSNLEETGEGDGYWFNFPKKSGTIALLEDLQGLGGGGSSSSTSASGTVEKINFEITDDDDSVSIDISKYSYCEIELIHSTGAEGTDELCVYIGPSENVIWEGLFPDDSQGRRWTHNIIIDTTGFVRMTYYDSHNNLEVMSKMVEPSVLTDVSFYWYSSDGTPSSTLYYVLKGVVK